LATGIAARSRNENLGTMRLRIFIHCVARRLLFTRGMKPPSSFRSTALSAGAWVIAAMALASCSDPPSPTFDVVIHVDGDPGQPLSGATLIRDNRDVAATDATGNARLIIRGTEGMSFDYMIRCPIDYESPTKPVTVVLRTMVDKNRPPEYPVACAPQIRRVVVALRADGGQNLPVIYLKQRVAITDASGAATVLLNMRPGDQFELGLDTSAKGYERLRPQNPIQAFHVNPKDEVIPWNAKFTLEQGVVHHAAVRRGPTPL